MTLTIIIGRLGSGKTLLMTYLAFINQKRKIYSNYSLYFNRELWNIKDFDLSILLNKGKDISLVLIDEAYNYFEARLSNSIDNILGSDVLFQSRKKGMDIYLTLQELRTIDVRFRELSDIFIECLGYIEKYNCYKYRIYTENSNSVLILPYEIYRIIYNLYDTYEVVISDRTKQLMMRYESKEDKLIRIDENIPKFMDFMEECNLKRVNNESIGVFCENNELPKNGVFIKLFKYEILKRIAKTNNEVKKKRGYNKVSI